MYVRLASKNEKFENELAIPTDSIFYALSSDVVNVTIGGHVGCQRASQREEGVAAPSAWSTLNCL